MKKLLASLRDLIQLLPLGRLHFITQLDSRPFKSFSSYGEDALINGVLKRFQFLTGKEFEFSYIDVGAFKPVKSSNTYFLYKEGLRGTAIEPNRRLERLWSGTRPKDIFRSVACGFEGNQQLYFFGASAESNTLVKDFGEQIKQHQKIDFQTIQVGSEPLNLIVRNHKKSYSGDFLLDLDIEGLDYSVLQNFSFSQEMRPFLILVECLISESEKTESIDSLLSGKNYVLVGKTVISSLYADRENSFYRELLAAEYSTR